jgi:hypothetical protein
LMRMRMPADSTTYQTIPHIPGQPAIAISTGTKKSITFCDDVQTQFFYMKSSFFATRASARGEAAPPSASRAQSAM